MWLLYLNALLNQNGVDPVHFLEICLYDLELSISDVSAMLLTMSCIFFSARLPHGLELS